MRRRLYGMAAAAGVLVVASVYVVDRWARGDELDGRIESIRALAELPDWSDARWERVYEATGESRALRREDLGDDQRAILDEFDARANAAAFQRLEQSPRVLQAPLEASVWATREPVSAEEFLRQYGESAFLLGTDDEALREALRQYLAPRVSLRSSPEGAEVAFYPVDTFGLVSPTPLDVSGTTPVEDLSVPPGQYRVVARLPGYGHAEATGQFSGLNEYELELRIRPSSEVFPGMIQFPAGPATVGTGDEGLSPFHERTVTLGAFAFDPQEVTNAEYRRFVDETGHRWPDVWCEGYPEDLANRPVVGVSYFDAAKFAMWAGKRLPTFAEWERAGRGVGGRAFPWGDAEGPRANARLNQAGPREKEDDARCRVDSEVYARGAISLDDPEYAFNTELMTPEGAEHMLGNVKEWTETRFRHQVSEGTWASQEALRVVKGGGYESPLFMDLIILESVPAGMRDRALGFRCAKSILP